MKIQSDDVKRREATAVPTSRSFHIHLSNVFNHKTKILSTDWYIFIAGHYFLVAGTSEKQVQFYHEQIRIKKKISELKAIETVSGKPDNGTIGKRVKLRFPIVPDITRAEIKHHAAGTFLTQSG